MQYILTQMDKQPGVGGTELLCQINILDTVYWISQAWKEVETSTISKCFEKAGFIFPTEEPNTIVTLMMRMMRKMRMKTFLCLF